MAVCVSVTHVWPPPPSGSARRTRARPRVTMATRRGGSGRLNKPTQANKNPTNTLNTLNRPNTLNPTNTPNTRTHPVTVPAAHTHLRPTSHSSVVARGTRWVRKGQTDRNQGELGGVLRPGPPPWEPPRHRGQWYTVTGGAQTRLSVLLLLGTVTRKDKTPVMNSPHPCGCCNAGLSVVLTWIKVGKKC